MLIVFTEWFIFLALRKKNFEHNNGICYIPETGGKL